MTLDIAHGNYAAARDAATALVDGDALGVHSRVLPELVEAAGRRANRRWREGPRDAA